MPARSQQQPASAIPLHELQNRRFQILVEDRHPTEIGYEVEAVWVGRALSEAGVGHCTVAEDPPRPLLQAGAAAPTLERLEGGELRFPVGTTPGDRMYLFLGSPGVSTMQEWPVHCDMTHPPAGLANPPSDIADKNGIATFTIDSRILDALPRPAVATCLAVRGSGGSARRFLSAPLPIHP